MRIFVVLTLCLCQIVAGSGNQLSQEVKYRDRFINDSLCDLQWTEIRANYDKYFEIYDSWGKTPSGILKGHTTSLGHFQECLDTEVELKDAPSAGTFQGQYCLALIPLKTIQSISSSLVGGSLKKTPKAPGEIYQKDQTKIKMGICVPAACSEQKVSEKLGVKLRRNSCSINNQYKFEVIDYVAITLFSTIGLLILCSTIYDYHPNQSDSTLAKVLLAFSLRRNVKQLVSIPKTTSSSVDCLNGLRVFSMFWVIFGHIYMWNLGLPLMNFLDVPNWKATPFSMIIQTATVSVDTFLFISGFLIAWLGLKEMEKTKGKLNILSMYVHRYMRLTPVLAAAVLFVVSLLKFMGSGPYWHNFVDVHKKGCDEYWWSTLLYVQNYVNPTNICLGHSWYLAVDTQLYIVSPLILIGLWKWGKKFFPVLCFLSLLSIGCIFATFYSEGFNQVLGLAQGKRSKLIYVPTHTRYTSWLLGVAVGYVMYCNRFIKFRLPQWGVFLGWVVCFTTMLSVIFGPIHTTAAGYTPSVTEAVFYETFSRISWCVAIGWIVFACQSGYGGPVNSILSFKIWAPFCRLTYSMYIVHFMVQTTIFGNLKTDVTFSDFNAIQEFWASFGLTFCIAIIFVLSFESPIIGLEKIFFRKEKRRSPTVSTTSSQNMLTV